MIIHTIDTDKDYRNTLQEIEGLMMAKTGSPERERLDMLVTRVEDYEHKYYTLNFPDPIAMLDAIRFVID